MRSPQQRRCSAAAMGNQSDAEDAENDERMEKARSLKVQRTLASRLVEAQSRWLEPPQKNSRSQTQSKTKTKEGSDDASPGASFEEYGSGNDTIAEEAYTRGQWLLGLLVLQSSSSVVLQSYETLVRGHMHQARRPVDQIF